MSISLYVYLNPVPGAEERVISPYDHCPEYQEKVISFPAPNDVPLLVHGSIANHEGHEGQLWLDLGTLGQDARVAMQMLGHTGDFICSRVDKVTMISVLLLMNYPNWFVATVINNIVGEAYYG